MTEGRDGTPSWTHSPSAARDVRWFLLLRLRWIAAAGQAATVAATELILSIDVPILLLAVLISCTLASNAFSWFWSRRRGTAPRGQFVGGLLLTDVLILTGMLYVTGGPENPFTSLYLVHIVLAALMLPPRWTLALSVAAVAGYGVLFFFHMPIAMGHAAGHHHGSADNAAFVLHLRGMWVAFLITASFITYFVVMMSRGRHRMEAELAVARERVERNQRLAGLATLAAGAAHELGTPLGTIAVVAKELELRLRRAPQTAELGDDAQLIRAEVDRCRDVLARLSDQGGQARGETPEELTAASISEHLIEDLEARGGGPIRFEARTPGAKVVAPRRALLQALCNLVQNAFEADTDQEVLVSLWNDNEMFFASVRDTGIGMAPEVVARAAEPFFSTKGDGTKMGLGLFLAHAVATSLGGDLSIESAPGAGTTVTWSISCRPAPAATRRTPHPSRAAFWPT
jgi:two-component system sensor histidine kinase RegB